MWFVLQLQIKCHCKCQVVCYEYFSYTCDMPIFHTSMGGGGGGGGVGRRWGPSGQSLCL